MMLLDHNHKISELVKIGQAHKIHKNFFCTYIDDEAEYALFRIKKANGEFGKMTTTVSYEESRSSYGLKYSFDISSFPVLKEEVL